MKSLLLAIAAIALLRFLFHPQEAQEQSDLAIAAKECKPVQPENVMLKFGRRIGSAGLIQGNYVLTNAHVHGNQKKGEAVFSNGDSLSVTLVKSDASIDLALFRVEKENEECLPSLQLRDRALSKGEKVTLVSSPKGRQGTVTKGLVNSVNPSQRDGVRLSLEVDSGSSGSPLLDSDGFLVGVIRAKNRRDNTQSIAVPLEIVKKFVNDENSMQY